MKIHSKCSNVWCLQTTIVSHPIVWPLMGASILSPKLVLQGTRFHSDLALMEELNLLSDRAVILADNVLKPGAPLYIWHLAKGSCLDICHSICCICILLSIFLSFFDHKYIYYI